MAIKIFHTADLHLGMRFAGYPEIQDKLIHSRYETLENMVDIANKEKCDLFVISGDMFDRVTMKVNEIFRAVKALNEFDGELIIVLPGNHDFYIKDSNLWDEFSKHAGDRVMVLKEPGVYDLSQHHLNMKIYACPCHSKYSAENMINKLDLDGMETDDAIKIGLAHGSLGGVSPDFEKTYYPMTQKELDSIRLNLWLLGHTHLTWPINPDKNSRILIPGTPEPDGFDCKHAGNAFIITIESPSEIKIEKVDTGKNQFIIKEIFLHDEQNIHRMKDEYSKKKYQNAILRLILKGRLKKEALEKAEEAIKEISKHVLLLQTNRDELNEEITPELINSEFTQDSFPHKLLLSLLEEEEDVSARALQKAYDIIREIRHEN